MSLLVPTLEVQLECYEGPLAVLISLIKKNKVSIWDIPISTITERFLEYVELVKEMNLKIAEDFIEMASLLIFIKSKMLLPSGEGEEAEDPREELIERIMEYERFRTMAGVMGELPMLDRDVFGKGTNGIDGEADYDLLCLCTLFFELIKVREEQYLTIHEIRPTLEEKLAVLKAILETSGMYEWDMNEEMERNEKVATILGMLELARIRLATLSQRKSFGKIVLKRRDGAAAEKSPAEGRVDNA
ncbi:MAG TPA: segregation/condensation protein A [Syntrophorhabdaceae bacterium]|nr:segregation/condensation protein A [Syntrophorhabdaceae bacterium]HQM81972.1 segregation/condensation protein A [Syntrophorhabdaceae bacterium]